MFRQTRPATRGSGAAGLGAGEGRGGAASTLDAAAKDTATNDDTPTSARARGIGLSCELGTADVTPETKKGGAEAPPRHLAPHPRNRCGRRCARCAAAG